MGRPAVAHVDPRDLFPVQAVAHRRAHRVYSDDTNDRTGRSVLGLHSGEDVF